MIGVQSGGGVGGSFWPERKKCMLPPPLQKKEERKTCRSCSFTDDSSPAELVVTCGPEVENPTSVWRNIQPQQQTEHLQHVNTLRPLLLLLLLLLFFSFYTNKAYEADGQLALYVDCEGGGGGGSTALAKNKINTVPCDAWDVQDTGQF